MKNDIKEEEFLELLFSGFELISSDTVIEGSAKFDEAYQLIKRNLNYLTNNLAELKIEDKKRLGVFEVFAQWAENNNHFEIAKQIYKKLLTLPNPKRVQANYYKKLGFVLEMGFQKLEDAAIQYNKAIDLSPKTPYYYILYGGVLIKMRRYTEGRQQIEAGLKLENDYAPGVFLHAISLLLLDKIDEAAIELERVINLKPKDSNYRHVYGTFLWKSKDEPEKAIEQYRIALKEEKHKIKKAQIHKDYGDCLYKLKRYEEAEEQYELAIELNNKFADAYYNYANLLEFNPSKHLLIKELYKTAIKLKPDETNYRYSWAVYWFGRNNLRAKYNLRRALKLAKKQNHPKRNVIPFVLLSTPTIFKFLDSGKKLSFRKTERIFRRTKKHAAKIKLDREIIQRINFNNAMLSYLTGNSELKRRNKKPGRALNYLEQAEVLIKNDESVAKGFRDSIKHNMAVAYWHCGAISIAKKLVGQIKDDKSALKLLKVLEDVEEGRFKLPFPGLKWGWIIGVFSFWGVLFLLSILKLKGTDSSLLNNVLDFLNLNVVPSPFLESVFFTLFITSIVLSAVRTLYPLLKFIRHFNVPWLGDIDFSPFLVELGHDMMASFIEPTIPLSPIPTGFKPPDELIEPPKTKKRNS